MLEMQTLLLFSAASLALAVSPGPDMILVVARTAAQGRLAGLVTQLGVSAGSAVHALILALGLSQLFLAVPYAYDTVRYIGAAYLLYLAWQAFAAKEAFGTASQSGGRLPLLVIFRQGILSDVLNPKVALFYLALFPQFLNPEAGSVGLQILILALILLLIDLAVHLVLIWVVGGMRALSPERWAFARWSRYVLGLVFGGLAAKLVFDGQR